MNLQQWLGYWTETRRGIEVRAHLSGDLGQRFLSQCGTVDLFFEALAPRSRWVFGVMDGHAKFFFV